jgi:IS5 family transposase
MKERDPEMHQTKKGNQYCFGAKAQDMANRRAKTERGVEEEKTRKSRTKSRVRAKVERAFCISKRIFGYTKVRYRGIKKNHEWLLTALAPVNLYQHCKRLVLLGA